MPISHTTNITFRPQPVDPNTVILTIKQLRESSSSGADEISLRFIKDALPVIIPFITCIINTSIVTGTFPTAWKHAVVTPLFKKGDQEDVSNYRPISLLPVFSKLIEKIVANQLARHLEHNSLISNTQHGFRPKLSTETALMQVSDKIYKTMDKKEICLLTLCDLSKAFDSVHHVTLLRKCNLLGIDSFWFQHYLSNRTQSVKVGNKLSDTLQVSFGVPQGSILGPILFNIYVNDLSEEIKDTFLIQYADDTQFIHTGSINSLPRIISNTEETLAKVKTYFNKNGLLLNSQKTQCIFIGTRALIAKIPDDTTIRSGEATIHPSTNVKNLGLHFDRHMLFDVHLTETSKKVSGILMFVNRIQDQLSKEARLIAVQTLALSRLSYCITIWGSTTAATLKRAQKLQNFAAKVAKGGASKFDHVTPILNELQWLTINQQFTFELCLTVFKALRNQLPAWLLCFPEVSDIITTNTRQQNLLYIPRARTDCGSRAITVRGPKLWNNLPSNIKERSSLQTLKSALKHHLKTSG